MLQCLDRTFTLKVHVWEEVGNHLQQQEAPQHGNRLFTHLMILTHKDPGRAFPSNSGRIKRGKIEIVMLLNTQH